VEYRPLGWSGLKVPALGLGTVYFGTQVPEAEAERIVQRAIDLDVTFVDTAEIYMRPRYGAAEEILGRALAGRRHQVILATKKRYDPAQFRSGTPADHGLSGAQIVAGLEGSLRRLRTDYVDLYYPHQVDLEVPLDETLRAIGDLVRAGKVRYVGLSNYTAWQVTRSLQIADTLGLDRVACVQTLYNLLDRGVERELVPCCAEFGLGIVAYSPLAGGVLTGKYGDGATLPPAGSRAALGGHVVQGRPGHIPVLSERNLAVARRLADFAATRREAVARLAIAWLLRRPQVASVIVGASTVRQLEEDVKALDITLSEEDVRGIERFSPGPPPAAGLPLGAAASSSSSAPDRPSRG
jgi:aryl-alcohol dehydrogenase-like predicted oxidoreductase